MGHLDSYILIGEAGLRRGKEREERGEAEKNPKKAFLFSQSPHSE